MLQCSEGRVRSGFGNDKAHEEWVVRRVTNVGKLHSIHGSISVAVTVLLVSLATCQVGARTTCTEGRQADTGAL